MESRSTQPEGQEMVQKNEMLEKQQSNEEEKIKMLVKRVKGIHICSVFLRNLSM